MSNHFEDYIDEIYCSSGFCSSSTKPGKPNNIVSLELTLSLRKSNHRDYEKHYEKIKQVISKIPDIKILSDAIFFERGGISNHLHFHSKIDLEIFYFLFSPYGLIEQISKIICKVIRRQYNEKYLYNKFLRYISVPFVLQINERAEWDEYIRKDIEKK